MKRKIGILGGTFDPVHYGHLMIAENAKVQFELESIWFVPTGRSPHKEDARITNSTHRCEMLKAALEDNEGFSLSMREIESEEICYTYKTLQRLCAEHPDTEWYFIMGADSLFQLEQWKKPEVILASAVILAAVRDDKLPEDLERQIAYLKERYQARIYPLSTPNFSISSSGIRQRTARGASIRYQLPECVRTYIEKNGLYRTVRTSGSEPK